VNAHRWIPRSLSSTVLAFALLAGVACSNGPEVPAGKFARITGLDSLGDRVTITWAPDGGDIVTSANGIEDEVWFRGTRVLHRDAFDGLSRLDGDAVPQNNRVVLEGELLGRPVEQQRFLRGGLSTGTITIPPRAPITVVLDGSGRIGQAGLVLWPDFTGRFATSWGNWRGVRFTADQPVAFVDRFPAAPRSTWDRGDVRDRVVTASIDGKPVRAAVETVTGGLSVSEGLVARLHAQTQSWGGSMYEPEQRTTIAVLHDLVLAGTRVDLVAARVVAGTDSVLYAGIDMFPRAGLLIRRGGRAEVTTRSCNDGSLVLFPGVRRIAINGVAVHGVADDLWPPLRQVLIDSAYDGPPVVLHPALLPPEVGMPVQKAEAVPLPDGAALSACVPRPIALTRNGDTIARDASRCLGTPPMSGLGWNVLIGQRSLLHAENLLVDLQNNRVCWYN
jgi:hypothetical protein